MFDGAREDWEERPRSIVGWPVIVLLAVIEAAYVTAAVLVMLLAYLVL